jgi:hypothetical protein
MAGEASNEVATPFAFAVYGVDRGEAETDRRVETTLDAQIRDGLPEEIAELDRRSWFRKLGTSQVDHRSAVKTIVSRLQ